MNWTQTILLSVLLATVTVGCQAPPAASPITPTHGGNEPGDQLGFWHTLTEQPLVSNDDAMHALLLFTEQRDDTPDYPHRVGLLKTRGLLPASFKESADQPVTYGTLAVGLAAAMEMDGSVMMRLLGPTPRYATRHLFNEGIYLSSSSQQYISGSEFVAIIGRAEDCGRRRPAYVPAKMLPGEYDRSLAGDTGAATGAGLPPCERFSTDPDQARSE